VKQLKILTFLAAIVKMCLSRKCSTLIRWHTSDLKSAPSDNVVNVTETVGSLADHYSISHGNSSASTGGKSFSSRMPMPPMPCVKFA